MGSFGDGDYSKGDNPALGWVQRGIDRHNATCANRASAAPLRLKLLALIGIRRPFDRWQEREPIWPYYPLKRKENENEHAS